MSNYIPLFYVDIITHPCPIPDDIFYEGVTILSKQAGISYSLLVQRVSANELLPPVAAFTNME